MAVLLAIAAAALCGYPVSSFLTPEQLAAISAAGAVPMAIGASVPTGTTFYIATAYGSDLTVSAASNASECVLTVTAHGLSNGDFVEVTSGWGRLNKRVFRIKSVSTNAMTLEGADTSSTTFFPALGGTGTVRKLTTLTQVTLVLTTSSSGGDPKTVNYKYIESDVEYSINDGFNAVNYTMDIDADAIGTAGYTALKSLTDVQTATCLKMVTRSGAIVLYPCTVALNESVKLADGQINAVTCAFNGLNRNTRYAS